MLLPSPSSMRAPATTPAEPTGAFVVRFPPAGSLPRETGGSASALLVSRPARRFYVLFVVMRCRSPISLRNQGRAVFLQRITDCVYSDRRYAMSPLLSRYDLLGAGSSESKSATAFAFLSRSISA